jgi:sugar lactone lactonase YvrE
MVAQTFFKRVPAQRIVLAAGLTLALAPAAAQTNFGAVNLGASATATATVTLPYAATLGSVAVVTQGAVGLDFTNAGGGSCTVGSNYAEGDNCTVQVKFAPVYAGERYGAVLLTDASGNRIGSSVLAGEGMGPQIAFGSGAAIAIAPLVNGVAFNNPFDTAVDGKGDLFLTDSNNARVVELPADGGAPIAIDPIAGGSGLLTPGGVAMNGAGDLYISDLDRNIVMVVPAGGGPPAIINPMVNGTGLRYPCGMVIDGAGDLYIADVDNARVVEVPAGGGAPIAIDPLVDGAKLSYPVTLALDSSGNLFIADMFANRVVEVPADGSAASAIDPSVNGQSLYFPYGVAVDAADNLFIADANNRVVEVPAGNGAATEITPVANGKDLNDPIGIALDAGGNLYIADSQNNRIVEVLRAQPPAINFAATAAGTLSSDSPKTVTMQNAGNAALTFPAPLTGSNPAISTNFTLDSTGTSACPAVTAGALQPGTLAVGAACGLAIGFQPSAAGSVYGSLTFESNNLGAAAPAYATQTIALSGDAPVAAVSAEMVAFGPQQVQMTSAPQQVTLTNTGSAPLTITNVDVTGANASAFSFPNSCTSNLAVGSNCVISGQFTPAAAGPMSAQLTITDAASASPQTVALSGVGVLPVTVVLTPTATNITTAQSVTITIAVSGASGEPTPTGSVALASGTYNLGTQKLAAGSASVYVPPGALTVGTDAIEATYTPDNASAGLYVSATGQTSVTVSASSTATAPAAATSTASAVTSNAATLAGAVNPNGADTHAWFLWGTSSTLSGASQTATQDLGSASGNNAVSAALSGLTATTTYYYQVVAQNSVGTSSGAIFSFTTDFAPYFSVLTGAPLTVARGATTGNTSTVSLSPWYGFTGTVNLSCAITPVAANDPATCSLPATASISGENATTVTLTVNTTAASAMNQPMRFWSGPGGAALACVVLLIVPVRRRRWLTLMAWLLLFVAVAGVGCGGGSSAGNSGGGGNGPPPNPGTTPGTYTVTITGVSGSITETGTLALTVQ